MQTIKKQYSSRTVPGTRKQASRSEQEHVARYMFAAARAAGKPVLDIACGTGYGSRILKDAGAVSVVGLDVSPDAVTFAKRNHALDGIQYVCANAEATDNLGPFDMIVSFETIEHVHDYEKTLKNLYRMLKPGGTMVMSTPNRPVTSPNAKTINDRPENDYHVREFDLPEFRAALTQAGFRISEDGIYGQCMPQTFPNRLVRKLSKLFGWFENPNYRAEVRPLSDLPSLRFITVVASKQS